MDDVLMERVQVTASRHTLSFSSLSPRDFERLCLGLISRRRGYRDAEHLGAAGRDRGRDIAVRRVVDGRSERVYVQCKRIASRPGKSVFSNEINKLMISVEDGHIARPDVVLFVVTQNLSGDLRSAVADLCGVVGMRAEFLGLTELDDELSRHDDLIAQFFALGIQDCVRATKGDVPFERVTPHHFGPRRVGFVNRVDELAELDVAAASPALASRVVVLSGPQGTGKSRLAEEWAQRQKEHYPDGQLYVDFRILRASASSSVAESLRSGLEALGCPIKAVPERLMDRQGLYRTVTAGQRMMLLLDHVDEAGEVRSLIPDSPDSLVLVTTNADLRVLKVEGAVHVPVATLDVDHARVMLHTRVGCPPDGVDELRASETVLSYCGGLSLAVELCATQIRDEGGGNYGWLEERLTDEKTRLKRIAGPVTSLDVVFGTAYYALAPDLARAYRLIARAPRLSTWAQVCAVLGADGHTSRRLVSLLASRNLIEVNGDTRAGGVAGERLDVGMHDLLRLHGRTVALRVDPAESTELVRRVGRYAAARARQIDRAISAERLRVDLPDGDGDTQQPPLSTGADAARQFAVERAFLVAAQTELESAGEYAAVCVIADALWPAMYGRGYNREIAVVFESGVRAAERLGDASVLCRLRMLLARGLGIREDYSGAIEQSRLAIELARAEGDEWLLGSALEVSGVLLLDSRGPAHALPVFEESRAAFPDEGTRGRAIQDHHIGMCFDLLNQPKKAIEAYGRAISALTPLEDHVLLARTGWRLAEALATVAREDEAIAAAAKAEDEATVAGEYAAQGRAMLLIAQLSSDHQVRREKLSAAIVAFTEAADEAWAAEARERLAALNGPDVENAEDAGSGQAFDS